MSDWMKEGFLTLLPEVDASFLYFLSILCRLPTVCDIALYLELL